MHPITSFFRYHLPLLLWAGIIFYLSSIPDLTTGSPSISVEVIVRKFAHIAEYALLGFLLYRVFYHGFRLTDLGAASLSILFLLGYAISDEVHQMFVPGRSGKSIDVLVDFLGGWIGIHGAMIAYHKKMRWWDGAVMGVVLFVLVGITTGLVFSAQREHAVQRSEESAREAIASASQSTEQDHPEPDQSTDNVNAPTVNNASESVSRISEEEPEEDASNIPAKIHVVVPFTTQAPLVNWDAVHEETCEEASLIMVHAYLKGASLTAEEVEKELQKMKAFQEKKYGDFKDSDMEQLAEIGKEYFGMKNLKVVYDFEKDELKKQLARNKPLILPTAGRKLGNPNFKHPGPLYHNLVAIGYDGDTIITNDPGTRKGKDYTYSLGVLYSAIHDFPGKPENIEKGRKAMIVVE